MSFFSGLESPLRVNLVLILKKSYHFIFTISSEIIQDCLLLFLSRMLPGCAYKVEQWQWPSCSDPRKVTPPHIAHSLDFLLSSQYFQFNRVRTNCRQVIYQFCVTQGPPFREVGVMWQFNLNEKQKHKTLSHISALITFLRYQLQVSYDPCSY